MRPAPGTDWAHSIVAVPIIGSNRALGAMVLQNHEREYAFGSHEVRLLETVAASMGLALENARLFDETQRHARELQEALAHQTATAEVLQVIGSSVADTGPGVRQDPRMLRPPVRRRCLRPADGRRPGPARADALADDGGRPRRDRRGPRWPSSSALMQSNYPMPLADTSAELAFRTGDAGGVRRRAERPGAPLVLRRNAEHLGRSFANLAAPLIWEGRGIGILSMQRSEVGPFRPSERALLKTFADQAVIAIQNARLFNETQEALHKVEERTAELTRVARIPDRDQRRAARHQRIADRRDAGVRGHPGLRDAAVRQPDFRDLQLRRPPGSSGGDRNWSAAALEAARTL